MMRNELEERLGYKLENWQWELSHEVYQNHPTIKDIGGKEQIADIVRQGFNCNSPIFKMFNELPNKPAIIKKHDADLYSEWDVTYDGYCINETAKTQKQVYDSLNAELKAKHHELCEHIEYFSINGYSRDYNRPFPIHSRIAIFYVRGGSEGYYVHVDTLQDGNNHNQFLVKTLLEGEAGITWAENMVCAISRIMKP